MFYNIPYGFNRSFNTLLGFLPKHRGLSLKTYSLSIKFLLFMRLILSLLFDHLADNFMNCLDKALQHFASIFVYLVKD